jgi:hypothetical protein
MMVKFGASFNNLETSSPSAQLGSAMSQFYLCSEIRELDQLFLSQRYVEFYDTRVSYGCHRFATDFNSGLVC